MKLRRRRPGASDFAATGFEVGKQYELFSRYEAETEQAFAHWDLIGADVQTGVKYLIRRFYDPQQLAYAVEDLRKGVPPDDILTKNYGS